MKEITNDKIPARFTLRPKHGLDDASLTKLAGLLHALESNPDDAMALQEVQNDGLYLAVAGNLEAFKGMLKSPVNPIAKTEVVTLSHYEAIIERGQQTFLEVGTALAQIREQKLYRTKFKTFEVYCRTRWSWKRQHAYRLINAAEVVTDLDINRGNETLSPIGDIVDPERMAESQKAAPKPTNEAQVRPLVKLPRVERKAAWMEACDESDGQPTAAKVEEIVVRRLGQATAAKETKDNPPDQSEGQTTVQDDTFAVAVCYQKDAKTLMSHYRNIVLLVLSPVEKFKAGRSKSLCTLSIQGTVPEAKCPLSVLSGVRRALEKSWPDALKLSPGLSQRDGWKQESDLL